METPAQTEVNIFGKKTTKEALDKATVEELKKWSKWLVTGLIWYFLIKSTWVYWFDHDQVLSLLYTLLSVGISVSNGIYSLQEKLKNKGLI